MIAMPDTVDGTCWRHRVDGHGDHPFIVVTDDGSLGSSGDQRTRTSPTFATHSRPLGRTPNPLRVSRPRLARKKVPGQQVATILKVAVAGSSGL